MLKTLWMAEFDLTADRAICNFSRNSVRFSVVSVPVSGLPWEYMVASLPSRMNRNQPLLPFESSSAHASDQMYKQSLPGKCVDKL